jgi:hypothetical protein
MRGPQFSSMKITQDVREYAAQKEIEEQAALQIGRKKQMNLSLRVERFINKRRRRGVSVAPGVSPGSRPQMISGPLSISIRMATGL